MQEPLLLHECSFEGLSLATSRLSAQKAQETLQAVYEQHLVRAALMGEALTCLRALPVRGSTSAPEQRHAYVPLLARSTEPSMAERGMHIQEVA